MITEILIATVAALSQAASPMSGCGVQYSWLDLRVHGVLLIPDREYKSFHPSTFQMVELPVTGTREQIDCAEQAVRLGTGDDAPRRRGSRTLSRVSAQTSAVVSAPPDWFIRCWSGARGSAIRDAQWDERTWDGYVQDLVCDETRCWATTMWGEHREFPLAHCLPIAVMDLSHGESPPPLGYPVRFVLPIETTTGSGK